MGERRRIYTRIIQIKKAPYGAFLIWREYYARWTFTAFNPFGDSSVSKETASPSLSSSKVTPTRELLWKNKSFCSPSAVMKPKPLSVSLFIVPVIDLIFCLVVKYKWVSLRNRLYVTLLAPTLSYKYSIKAPILSSLAISKKELVPRLLFL